MLMLTYQTAAIQFLVQWLCHAPPFFPKLRKANSEPLPYVVIIMDGTKYVDIVVKRTPLIISNSN